MYETKLRAGDDCVRNLHFCTKIAVEDLSTFRAGSGGFDVAGVLPETVRTDKT